MNDHSRILRSSNHNRRIAFFLTLLSFGFFLYTCFWLLTVATPVVTVELTYQSRRILWEVFHVRDIRSLIIPKFVFRFDDTSKTPDGGIVIPKLFLDEPVVYNVDPNNEKTYIKALKRGIAHASSTALPASGGIGYYFAHSSSPAFRKQYNAVFYLLGKLKNGDTIILYHEKRRYPYKVSEIITTKPDDVSFLHRVYDRETIVLQTCWPPGTTMKRLLVFAVRAI